MLLQQKNLWQVLIVDDHELTRLSLQILLSQHSHLKVIGSVSNGREAISLVRQSFPDLVILDWQMPVINGCIAAREIKNIAPDTKIIFYSEVTDIASENVDLVCPKSLPGHVFLRAIDELLLTSPVIR
jgi:DNA-binding NarL/FixJ family response regulator